MLFNEVTKKLHITAILDSCLYHVTAGSFLAAATDMAFRFPAALTGNLTQPEKRLFAGRFELLCTWHQNPCNVKALSDYSMIPW